MIIRGERAALGELRESAGAQADRVVFEDLTAGPARARSDQASRSIALSVLMLLAGVAASMHSRSITAR